MKGVIAVLVVFGAPAFAPRADADPAPEVVAAEEAPAPAHDDDSLDEIDLASLGLAPDAPTFDDKLQFYGFADFAWTELHLSSSLAPSSTTFGVGNVNLYLRKNLDARWRALTEVRLLFAPNGAAGQDGTITDTAVADNANLERPIAWGGIAIERVYVEYDITPALTLRAGHFLTPYGIWNIDHGSPTVISITRPYIVGEQFFPEHQTGLELFGTKALGEYQVEYHATVSNGRNPYEATRDPDRRPAFGGRLQVTAPWAGSLRAGLSAYAGRASETTSTSNSGPSYDEKALGADVAWDHGGLHLQGEVLGQLRRYRDGHRAVRGAGFAPDGDTFGAYALAGYRLASAWNAMPYVLGEIYHPFDDTILGNDLEVVSGGVNLRPIPALVLKVEANYARLDGEGLLTGPIVALRTQAAWVF